MAKAAIAVHSDAKRAESDRAAEAVSLFFDTLAAIGMSEKEAAYTMVIDPAQLSRVKSGQARLPFDAMWRLPNRFWFELRARVDAAKQLTEENARMVRVERITELIRLLLMEAA